MLHRRSFLELSGLATASLWYPSLLARYSPASPSVAVQSEYEADVVIIGGGLGGCAAALALLRAGKRVIMTEPTDWLGGQLTQQAVPPDEHPWIETTGRTDRYAELRNRIRDYYRRNYPLTEAAQKKVDLNPGNGSVSRLCHEPRVAVAVLDEMLAAAMSRRQLILLLNCLPIEASMQGDRIEAITIKTLADARCTLRGSYFIDASEEGDLLPLVKAEFAIGMESRQETLEPHASEDAAPSHVQSFTWCFAIDHVADTNHALEPPRDYDFWRNHVPQLNPPWPGKLLSLTYSNPRTLEPRELSFVPGTGDNPAPKTKTLNLWMYRRISDPSQLNLTPRSSGISIVNWPQNDYMLGAITQSDLEKRQKHWDESRQLSLSFLYWLQTEAPRPDGGQGWPGLRLRGDIVGTTDGLAKYPYIREARRIKSEFTILEQHLTREARRAFAVDKSARLQAAEFADSVGVGYYALDLHPRVGGANYFDVDSLPFQIPLGALIPQRLTNLIAGGKTIGTTHISNGCYRLHPIEWNIGESAGWLAAHCLEHHLVPKQVRAQADRLEDFQRLLTQQGIPLRWDDTILDSMGKAKT